MVKQPELSADDLLELQIAQQLRENRLFQYKPYGLPETLCPDGEMWKRNHELRGWELWSNRPWQLEFHNLGLTNKERMLLCANGVGKCITINSLVDTPSGPRSIREIITKGNSFPVLSWDGERVVEAMALPPFRKPGLHRCYRIVTRDGRWIECADHHRILSDGAWRSVQSLAASVRAHRRSSWARAQIARVSDALRSIGSGPGSLAGCLLDPHFDGGPLPLVASSAQGDTPSRADARACSPASSHLGGPGDAHTSSLSPSCGRPSRNSFDCLDERLSLPFSDRASWSAGGPSSETCPGSPLLSTAEDPGLRSDRAGDCRGDGVLLSLDDIISINPINAQPVFDFSVPAYGNYLGAGLVHHNTWCGAHEVALHMTGRYPDWWSGFRFDKPNFWWIGTITNESQREYTQPALLGPDLRANIGTGAIPKRFLRGKPSVRQAGYTDVVDSFFVEHISGGLSRGQFKAYKQGMRAWMGAPPDGIWLDEQPSDESLDERGIYEECQTRVIRTSGIILVTLTPLLGETEMISHFLRPKAPGIVHVGATWDDVAHLKEEDKARLEATYGKASKATRTKGVPMMGEGRAFDVDEDVFVLDEDIPQSEWPSHWWYIAGVDFGIDHPTAFAWLALDRDADIVYLLDDYRRSDVQDPIIHLPDVRRRGEWIPIAWPHDGDHRIMSRGASVTMSKLFREAGFNMLGKSARYDKEIGGPQPIAPAVLQINQRLKTGGFKVCPKCVNWLEEYRSFHIKDGKYSAVKEDTLKASFYAMMELSRHGMQKGMAMNPRVRRPTSMPLVGGMQ